MTYEERTESVWSRSPPNASGRSLVFVCAVRRFGPVLRLEAGQPLQPASRRTEIDSVCQFERPLSNSERLNSGALLDASRDCDSAHLASSGCEKPIFGRLIISLFMIRSDLKRDRRVYLGASPRPGGQIEQTGRGPKSNMPCLNRFQSDTVLAGQIIGLGSALRP